MKKIYFLITYSLFFFSQKNYAQLTNGMKSLGGFGAGQVYHYKAFQAPSTNQTSTTIGFGATPNYAVFKNNFLFGAALGSGLTGFTSKVANPNNNQKTAYINYDFNVNPSVRYYLKNNSKLGFFTFLDASYYGTLTTRKLQIGTTSLYAYNTDYFNWQVGFGGHIVIDKNFVFEGILSYERVKNIQFTASLHHFYNTLDSKNPETPPQYIIKNRRQIAASASANYNIKDKSNNVFFYFSKAKMRDNHFMVGSSASLSVSEAVHKIYTSFSLSPFVRYYIPISNRLFAYPYIGATVNVATKRYSSINFNRGIGFQYFMTRNLALTATTNGNFNHYKDDNERRTSANGLLSLGFDYFMK